MTEKLSLIKDKFAKINHISMFLNYHLFNYEGEITEQNDQS